MKRAGIALVLLAIAIATAWAVRAGLSPDLEIRSSAPEALPETTPLLDVPEDVGERVPLADVPEPRSPRPLRQLVVAGTIVDQRGAPVADAEIRVQKSLDTTWLHSGIRLPRSDAMGRFEFRGELPREHVLLVAWKENHCTGEARFDPGTRDLRVVLPIGSKVFGTIQADAAVLPETIEIAVSDGPEVRAARAGKDGKFSAGGVCSGDVRLAFSIDGLELDASPSSFRVDDVEEDLGSIDLRAGLRELVVAVEDAEGRAIDDALVVARGQDERDPDRARRTTRGRARFVARAVETVVEIEALGYRRERLSVESSPATVRLRPGILVRVVLGDSGELPPAPSGLSVAALVAVESPLTAIDGIGPVGPDRTASFRVGSPGLHEIAWYFDGAFLVGTPRITVSIDEESETVQTIHVYLSPEVEAAWRAEQARSTTPDPSLTRRAGRRIGPASR